MKYATTLAVLLMVVSAVSAAPSLSFTSTDVGGGLMAYDFFVSGNDGLMASYATTLYFLADAGSTINQMMVFGALAVDTEPNATTYDGNAVVPPPYSKAKDTWVYSPFGENPIPGTSPRDGTVITGIRQGTNWFEFALATGAGSLKGDNTPVLHLVAGGLLKGTWTGTISRASVQYPTAGAYPEPATMALLSIGALGLIRRRR